MDNKRKLKQKFRSKQLAFLVTKGMYQLVIPGGTPKREWGKKKVKWETWTLTSDKVVEFNADDIGSVWN